MKKIEMLYFRRVKFFGTYTFLFYISKLPFIIVTKIYSLVKKKRHYYLEVLKIVNALRMECKAYDVVKDKKHSIKCYYKYNENYVSVRMRFFNKAQEEHYLKFISSVELHSDFKVEGIKFKNGFCYFGMPLNFEPIYEYHSDNYSTTVGNDYSGMITWEYKDIPHALVIGESGQGKSVYVRYLLKSLFSSGIRVWCVDGKVVDYTNVKEKFCRYVANDGKDKSEIISFIEEFIDKMKERQAYMQEQGILNYYENDKLEPEFLLVDELLLILETSDKKETPKIKRLLTDILLQGRAFGFFLIATMQRADAKYIDGALRDNFGMYCIVGSASKESYNMIFNKYLKGFEKGKGWLKIGENLHTIAIPFYEDF